MTKLVDTKKYNLSPKLNAFPYQKEAVDEVKDLEYGGIFHEQGLGKTKIALDIALYWLNSKIVDSVIFVTKKGLIKNWKEEIVEHSHLKGCILGQKRSENFIYFNSPFKVYITHYEVIKSEEKRLKLFLKTRDVGIVLDEAHKIKNPEAAVTSSFFALREQFKRRLILTGTPVANRPYDIWAPIYFLDGGASLGESFTEFKEGLDIDRELAASDQRKSDFEDRLSLIFDQLSEFCVRETKDGGKISLPNKEIVAIETDWEPLQLEIYQKVRKDMRAVIVKDGMPTEDISEEVLKRLLRLIQIASNPQILDESYTKSPGKIAVLEELLNTIVSANEKVIVWSSFTDNVNWLHKRYKELSPAKVHGKLSIDDRNKSIDRFKSDPECKVLFATPGAAKEGLTLTVANHVIFFDRTFSLDDYLQSQDRIHRISQTKTCYVYNLLMRDSIDEWVDVLLSAKSTAAKMAQGDISRAEFSETMDYSFSEILDNILGNT